MDYASRLNSAALSGGTAQTLAGDYARFLGGQEKPPIMGGGGGPLTTANGYDLRVGNPDALPPEVARILQMMTGELAFTTKPRKV